MSLEDMNAGLVIPCAAVALLRKGRAVRTCLIVFMAVTSASLPELIAVSSIFTYDIYHTYIKPDASGGRLIYMSYTIVVGFGLFMATFSTGFVLRWY
jgi:Na+/proline symporter